MSETIIVELDQLKRCIHRYDHRDIPGVVRGDETVCPDCWPPTVETEESNEKVERSV